jgi:IMP cyclohydrolase
LKGIKQKINLSIEKLKNFPSHSEVAHRLNEQETTPCVQMIDRQLVVGAGSIISSLADKLDFSKVN